jgi:hypothetical protein
VAVEVSVGNEAEVGIRARQVLHCNQHPNRLLRSLSSLLPPISVSFVGLY